jgi:hypothetical protein
MPVTSFDEYARSVTDRLHGLLHSGQAVSLSLEVDQRSMLHGMISGFLTFKDQSELHFREFVDTSLSDQKLSFAYHFQSADGKLIFRYDNAAHRPSLSRRSHKHIRDRVFECPVPALLDVIDEISKGAF